MLNVLTGRMATGKSTIVKELKNHGYKELVSFTTRPIRQGEVHGKDYFFIRQHVFEKLIEKDFFIETRKYKTKQDGLDATWYYGLSWDSYLDNQDGIVILDFKGTKELAEKIGRENMNVVYLTAPMTVLRERVIGRGDNHQEMERRLLDDKIAFRNAENYADSIVDASGNLEGVINSVLSVLK